MTGEMPSLSLQTKRSNRTQAVYKSRSGWFLPNTLTSRLILDACSVLKNDLQLTKLQLEKRPDHDPPSCRSASPKVENPAHTKSLNALLVDNLSLSRRLMTLEERVWELQSELARRPPLSDARLNSRHRQSSNEPEDTDSRRSSRSHGHHMSRRSSTSMNDPKHASTADGIPAFGSAALDTRLPPHPLMRRDSPARRVPSSRSEEGVVEKPWVSHIKKSSVETSDLSMSPYIITRSSLDDGG